MKLQAKLSSPVPDDTKTRRTFTKSTTDSVDEWVQMMLQAGWVEAATIGGPPKKTCSRCRDDKTRRCFARRQWRSNDPECACCTSSQADKDRRDASRRLQVALDNFVPPSPRPLPVLKEAPPAFSDSKRWLSSGTAKSKRNEKRQGPEETEQKKKLAVKSYRVVVDVNWVQIYTGPGAENEKLGRLYPREKVTEFAAVGCWIRITCGLHNPQEWVCLRSLRASGRILLEPLSADAVPVPKDLLCSFHGCTAAPSTKAEGEK